LAGLLLSFPAYALWVDQILAVVNGEVITASDLRAAEVAQITAPHGPPDGIDKGLLQSFIDERLLMAEGKRFEIQAPSEGEVQEAFQRVKDSYSTEERFQATLREKGVTEKMLEEVLRRRLMVGQFLDQRINFFVLVTPEEVTNYFESHRADYGEQELDEALREKIEKLLIEEKAKKRQEEYLIKLRANAKIRINAIDDTALLPPNANLLLS
jgi:hypothetical protein